MAMEKKNNSISGGVGSAKLPEVLCISWAIPWILFFLHHKELI